MDLKDLNNFPRDQYFLGRITYGLPFEFIATTPDLEFARKAFRNHLGQGGAACLKTVRVGSRDEVAEKVREYRDAFRAAKKAARSNRKVHELAELNQKPKPTK